MLFPANRFLFRRRCLRRPRCQDRLYKDQQRHLQGQVGGLLLLPEGLHICVPTELVEFGKKLKDFAERDAVLVAGSTDNEFSHQAWRKAHPI